MNAVVGQLLRCTIHENKGGNWEILLPTVEMTINSLPNSSTGYSPFYLNYGYHPTVPIELLKGDEETKLEAVDSFVSRVQNVWNHAKKKLMQFVQTQANYYNKKHREVEHNVGDLVLLSSKSLSFKGVPTKLKKKFLGPFEIVEKIGTQAYRLKLPDAWRIHPVFHVSLLKPWRPSTVQQVPGEVELEDPDLPQYFDVEKILRWRWNSKTRRRQREFLVLWQGYPMEDAEWISASYFSDQDALRADLEANRIPEDK